MQWRTIFNGMTARPHVLLLSGAAPEELENMTSEVAAELERRRDGAGDEPGRARAAGARALRALRRRARARAALALARYPARRADRPQPRRVHGRRDQRRAHARGRARARRRAGAPLRAAAAERDAERRPERGR